MVQMPWHHYRQAVQLDPGAKGEVAFFAQKRSGQAEFPVSRPCLIRLDPGAKGEVAFFCTVCLTVPYDGHNGVMSQKGAHIGVVKEERTGIIVFVHVSSLMPTNISVPTMCVLHRWMEQL